MDLIRFHPAGVSTFTLLILCAIITSCRPNARDRSGTDDSTGVRPTGVQTIAVHARSDLLESSSATITPAQPGIVFTINDSGNEPVLFALDTLGAMRGTWRINGAQNTDWEASSHGPCIATMTIATTASVPAGRKCLFIGDTGDNSARRSSVQIYQVAEPVIAIDTNQQALAARMLDFRYPDGPHDVEAMYVSRNGTTYLITKRPLRTSSNYLRPALVFALPASAWTASNVAVATLVDSVPIIPGSGNDRYITDASLSFDGRFLAVRTYRQIFVFATDSATGRVVNAIAPAVCNIDGVEKIRGEGISWFGGTRQLLLNSEELNQPMHRLSCPLPH